MIHNLETLYKLVTPSLEENILLVERESSLVASYSQDLTLQRIVERIALSTKRLSLLSDRLIDGLPICRQSLPLGLTSEYFVS